ARAEDEVARGDLVAEGLADLTDAERGLLTGRGDHVEEVHEDALCGLGAQEVQARLAGDGAEVGLDQAGELLRLGEVTARAAVGAGDLRHTALGRTALLGLEGLQQVVLAEADVAALALHERVGERLDVAGGLPHALGQDDRGVQAHHVPAGGHEGAPPLPLDVLLELHAERAVVPRGAGSAVDLTGREHEAALLGECDDVVQRAGGGLGHGETPGDGEGWNLPSIVTATAVTLPTRCAPGPPSTCADPDPLVSMTVMTLAQRPTRRTHLSAAGLGVGAALLAACGGGGGEPDGTLSVKQVMSVEQADLVLQIPGFQNALDDAIASHGGDNVLDVSSVVALLPSDAATAHEEHAGESEQEHAEHEGEEHEDHDHGPHD